LGNFWKVPCEVINEKNIERKKTGRVRPGEIVESCDLWRFSGKFCKVLESSGRFWKVSGELVMKGKSKESRNIMTDSFANDLSEAKRS
jgi:hypothetical protein